MQNRATPATPATRAARAAVVLTVLWTVAALAPAPAAAQQSSRPAGSTFSGMVTSQYDAATDSTRVRTAVVPVRGGLKMYAGYRFAGAEPDDVPSTVYLVFQEASSSPTWESPRGRTLELWVDDRDKIIVERTEYMRHAGYVRGPVTMDVTEWVWATIPPETFAKIAGAKKVEGRLGTRRFAFGIHQLEPLRQLASSLPPTSASAAGEIDP